MAEEQTGDVIDDTQTPPPGDDAKQDPPPGGADDIIDSGDDDDAKAKTDDDLLSDDEASDDEGVPDQYTFEPPEGVAIDEAVLEEFKGIAKEIGLSQKGFDRLVEMDLKRSQAATEKAVEGWNERVNGWREGARTDGDIGGENFDASVKTANRLVKQFGDDGLRALLRSPSEQNPEGLAIGNNPAFLRFVNRIAAVISDPDPVEGDDRQAPDTSFSAKAAKMYPSMQSKK